MQFNARPLATALTVCVLMTTVGCRGDRGAIQDTLLVDTAITWSEAAVFGFADAALSLLLNDSEIGVRSARRDPVRQLASRMQRDYRALAGRMDSLSERRGVVPHLPSGFEFVMQHRAAATDLRNMDRRPFDDRYLEHVVTGHHRVMDRMYEALSAAQDESVRRLLEDAQRRLETNLAEATRLKNQGGRATTRNRS
jgi:predicted outer membrane protein